MAKKKFRKKIGPKNRMARAVAGVAIVALSAYYLNEPWRFVGVAIGGFMIVEAIMGFCIWHLMRGTKDMR